MFEQTPLWYWVEDNQIVGPKTMEDPHAAIAAGRLQSDDVVSLDPSFKDRFSPFSLNLPNLRFSPPLSDFIASRQHAGVTVICGPNNCGKTVLLKALYYLSGVDAYLLNVNRFSQFDVLSYAQAKVAFQVYRSFRQNLFTQRLNFEDNLVSLQEIIVNLSDAQRKRLFEFAEEVLGYKLDIALVDTDNKEFSPRYVTVGDVALARASTGTRLLLTLFALCFDTRFSVLMIDEPELGLHPRAQTTVARTICDDVERSRHFPHVKHVYLATHSHLFCDRKTIPNNYVAARDGATVYLTQIDSIAKLNNLQFSLSGNELETMFLPSSIDLCEGKIDEKYLGAVFTALFPMKPISVVQCQGDGGVLNKLDTIRASLGDLFRSACAGRVFVCLDQTHGVSLEKLRHRGVDPDNTFVWPENGIEFMYPSDVLGEIFAVGREFDYAKMRLQDRAYVVYGDSGILETKESLAQKVSEKVGADNDFPEAFRRLIRRVREVVGDGDAGIMGGGADRWDLKGERCSRPLIRRRQPCSGPLGAPEEVIPIGLAGSGPRGGDAVPLERRTVDLQV